MKPSTLPPLKIPGFTFADLESPQRLAELDRVFLETLAGPLAGRLREARENPSSLGAKELSNLLTDLAPSVSSFIGRLFGIEADQRRLTGRAPADEILARFKRDFLLRRAVKAALPVPLESADVIEAAAGLKAFEARLFPDLPWESDEERATALMAVELVELDGAYSAALKQKRPEALTPAVRERVAGLARRSGETPDGPESEAAFIASLLRFLEASLHLRMVHPVWKASVAGWASFRLPEKVDPERLVATIRPDPALPERRMGPEDTRRRRDGFDLTDPRMTPREVAAETHYCLLCHDREKDSCSKGFFDSRTESFQKNALGVTLSGCPLDEKISEMHQMQRGGDAVAALAIVCVDNPMCPGTGHRICNDCMKGCIFQKQTPVNIPQIETGVLTDVLNLPWGVEIYVLLTRWNPLNFRRPFALPYNGRNVLVVGLGPAGYTLAHYLLQEGFGVVGIDGLKIEPVADAEAPIRDFSDLRKKLDERPLSGFGGVSEYGITVRWDKNFLTLIQRSLWRRPRFRAFGGVRFGGTVTAEDAVALGFDHVAIAAGAGRPTIVGIKHNMIRGIRQASDFLMALQLTGAFKKDALANLQAELPAIVIGGGLTAIDTATELLAYYPIAVERALLRYETLAGERGEESIRATFDEEEREILNRLLSHGTRVRDERRRAVAAGEAPDFARLCREWGGVSIAYRRTMEESPAYRLNHEEIIKALEEGISFIEGVDPLEAVPDEFGKLAAMRFRRPSGETVELPARSCLVAAGTTPNITYAKEHQGSFPLDEKKRFFAPHRAVRDGGSFKLEAASPSVDGAIFCGVEVDGKFVTFFGDNHPRYNGNVVKAMASARDGYPWIAALFEDELRALRPEDQGRREESWRTFSAAIEDAWTARVERVERLTPTIVEVILRAPAAARKFRPGQFYRLQNFEALSPRVDGVPLMIEPLALTGASTDPENGLLSMIALELGASSRLCAALKPGDPVIAMGPTGSPTEIPENSTVLLCGGGLGNAVLFSIGKACRAAGSRVLYFAGYKKAEDFYKRADIEAAADVVIFSVDRGDAIPAERPQDRSLVGNILQAMLDYSAGRLGPVEIPLQDATRMIVIGSDRMMAAVARARHAELAPHLSPGLVGIASINSPMQCMMKEICAQCLQKHKDPVTGATKEIVFSCFNQDQLMDEMDWGHLAARLRQNTVSEKLTNLWLDRLYSHEDPRRI